VTDRSRPNTLTVAALLLAAAAPRAAGADLPSPRATWRSLETENFRVVGDVGARRIAETAERLETFRAALARLRPGAITRSAVPTLVLALSGERSTKSYLILDGRPAEGYSGVFHDTRDGNYIVFDALAGDDPLDTVYSGSVIFFLNDNFPSAPHWLRKGFSEYYETFRAGAGEVEIGRPSERHLQRLREGWRLPLQRVVAVDHASPEVRDPDQYGRYSAHCWAMVHYLLLGDEQLAPKVPALLARVGAGESLDAALSAEVGFDLAELDRRLRYYVEKRIFRFQTWRLQDFQRPAIGEPVEIPRGEALTLLGEYLAHARATPAAREHLEAAAREGGEPGDVEALFGFLAESEGRVDEAAAHYAKALAASPRRASSLVHAARFALERADAAPDGSEARARELRTAGEAARRAVAIDPEHGEAHVYLGLAALRGGDPATALVAFTDAERRLPGKAWLVHNRFLAAEAAGQPAVARGILTGTLAKLDPALARRELGRLARNQQWEVVDAAMKATDLALEEERWDEAAVPLTGALAKVEDAELRARVEERLRQVEAFVLEQRRVDRYNEAVALANQRKYREARQVLGALLEGCGAEPICASARELAGRLDRQLGGGR
jgi:tetratricopeptide (TPR) repeat protein